MTTFKLTLESRRPASLGEGLFRELLPLVPDLRRWYYWTPHTLTEEDRRIWDTESLPCVVPDSVFQLLSGRLLWSDCYRVYESERAAIEDLKRVWNRNN